MDPTKMLEADHRMVEQMLTKIKQSEGDERAALIDELATALLSHMELEERVLYPKIEAVIGAEAVKEAETEHQLARKTLKDVMAMAPDGPGIGAAIDSLEAGIAHHVEEEETEVFPKLRSDGTRELAEMATPFMEKRMQLDMDVSAAALETSFSKEELVEEAKHAGIEHTASMNKHDLAQALAERMAS